MSKLHRNLLGTILWGIVALIAGISIPLCAMTIREIVQHCKYPYNELETDDLTRYALTIVLCGIARDAVVGWLLWQYINLY